MFTNTRTAQKWQVNRYTLAVISKIIKINIMKTSILFILFTLGLFTINAQDFQATTKYIVKTEIAAKQQAYEKTQIHILVTEDTSKKVATLVISDSDVFHEMRVSVLTNPALEHILEIIKVEFEYNGYSLTTYTYYFLVTNTADYVALPKITKVYDDITVPIVDYVFPTQKYGQEETIVKVKFHYRENYTIEEIEVLQRVAWNDDGFGTEDAIVRIENH
jgi:hypothetical protein